MPTHGVEFECLALVDNSESSSLEQVWHETVCGGLCLGALVDILQRLEMHVISRVPVEMELCILLGQESTFVH